MADTLERSVPVRKGFIKPEASSAPRGWQAVLQAYHKVVLDELRQRDAKITAIEIRLRALEARKIE